MNRVTLPYAAPVGSLAILAELTERALASEAAWSSTSINVLVCFVVGYVIRTRDRIPLAFYVDLQ